VLPSVLREFGIDQVAAVGNRIDGAAELYQRTVAGGLDNAPAIFRDLGVQKLSAQLLEPGERPRLV
jgi:hypothetical protein